VEKDDDEDLYVWDDDEFDGVSVALIAALKRKNGHMDIEKAWRKPPNGVGGGSP
jgi:hypothetical protein